VQCCRPGWYAQYRGAWVAAALTAATVWSTCSWGTDAGTCSYPAEPAYYDYGSTTVIEGDAGQQAKPPEDEK
jgi:hypothetical protein